MADATTNKKACVPERRPAATVAASAVALALALGGVPAAALADDGQSQASNGAAQNQPATPPDASGGAAPAGGQPPAGEGQAPGSGGGASATTFDYAGAYPGAKTADGANESSTTETIAATDADQNAVLVRKGGSLTLQGATLQKAGDGSSDDACN
ncbi:MAG: adhesin, partial [Eggerthellaceae bacterium]|nr:adhesin [Eggerthellaceae bacterium]